MRIRSLTPKWLVTALLNAVLLIGLGQLALTDPVGTGLAGDLEVGYEAETVRETCDVDAGSDGGDGGDGALPERQLRRLCDHAESTVAVASAGHALPALPRLADARAPPLNG
ncbi:MAG: hypothetical protein RLW61_10130 [Gammaproteobacteria bacterium]